MATTQTTRFRMACSACGGTDVRRDAYAEWDEDAQEWTLSATFDHAVCEDCGGETRIVEQPL